MSRNEQNEPKIVEDKPQMRSMQVMPAMPAPVMPRSLANPGTNRASTHRPTTKFAVPSSGGWVVRELAPLPPIYVLERTHIHVDDSVDNVANRIAACLRKESISSVYHDVEALVDAETEDHTQFSVRLWKGKKGGSVLVEVQKVDGCCYSFCQAAKAVLRAAKGMQAAKRRTFSIPPSVPRLEPDDEQAATKEGLEIAGELLRSKHLDSHLMAVQSLMHISGTCASKCFAARYILSGDLCETLLTLIRSFEIAEQGEDFNEVEKEHLVMMHRCALTVLANCLASLEQSGELGLMLERHSEITSTSVLTALADELSAAPKRPHDACQAAKCLHSMLSVAPDHVKRQASDICAFETISQARQTGACRHVALEDACEKLRELL